MPKAIILPNTKSNLLLCAQQLLNNKLVAFPTETVYGLGANATNSNAISLIFKTKQRPLSNPLIVHFASLEQIIEHCYINDVFLQLAVLFMPGPISIILQKKPTSNICNLCSNNNYIAVRIPNNKLALDLLELVKVPIAAPSANLANRLSPTMATHVKQSLEKSLIEDLLILDDAQTFCGVESTVVEIKENTVNILRNGYITKEDFLQHKFIVTNSSNNISNSSPGTGNKHYSPITPLIINCNPNMLTDNCGLLAFGDITKYTNLPKNITILNLSAKASLQEAASNLFKMLWHLDNLNLKTIYIMPIPNVSLGVAINEKLIKASYINK